MSIIDKYSNLIHQVPVKSVKAPLLLPMESPFHRKLGITREEIEEAFLGLEWWEIALRRVPDGGTLLCPQVDGFRGMPAAWDSGNSSGYGGAALARDSADSSSYGGGVSGYEGAADTGSAASGYEGAADKGSAASGYEGAADKGMTTVKPEDAPESGRGWIRDTSRLFWEKPIEDTLVRGRKPIGDHQFQSNRKGADRNRSQFGYGRPYWNHSIH